MAFDPTKPFGTINGACTICAGAKFEQAGKFYDFQKRELKRGAPEVPATAAETPPAATPPAIPAAAAPKPPKPADTVDQLQAKLVTAQKAAQKYPTPQKRAAVTKIENKLAALTQ